MRNILCKNDQIGYLVEQIGRACDDIFANIHQEDISAITTLAVDISNGVDLLYRELDDTEIPEETVALSVVQDFFEEHHIADNLSMGDVMKLEKALKEWYESIR